MVSISNKYTSDITIEGDNNNLNDDFGTVLDQCGIPYLLVDNLYLMIGGNLEKEDTIIYISVIRAQIRSALLTLLSELPLEYVTMRVVKNGDAAEAILNGEVGIQNIGKTFVLNIRSAYNQENLLKELINLTKIYSGPIIPSFTNIGGQLYVRPNGHVQNGNGQELCNSNLRLIKNKYLVTNLIKPHVRGEILAGMYFNRYFFPKRCLIKVSKKCMWSDKYGRDMKDRLAWQSKVQNQLSESINVPKFIDFFEENTSHYFIMEYVKGITFTQYINEIYLGGSWFDLSALNKIRLLEAFLKIVDIVNKIHDKQYVHRDLNPGNFIITAKNKIYVIDFELTCTLSPQYPTPPFGYGTHGFVSPEQHNNAIPNKMEDIYALGGCLIMLFTNLYPLKVDRHDVPQTYKSLLFLTGSKKIATVVSKCFCKDPMDRPKLIDLKRFLITSIEELHKVGSGSYHPQVINSINAKKIIQATFLGATVSELSKNDGLLYALGIKDLRVNNYRQVNGRCIGLKSPLIGMLWLLSEAASFDVDFRVYSFYRNYMTSYDDILSEGLEMCNPGLFYGSSGLAIALISSIKIEILPNNEKIRNRIEACFKSTSNTYDLANGVAGQLLACIGVYKHIPSNFFREKLELFLSYLLNQELKDGYWPLQSERSENKFINLGLESGCAGIIYSLIEYYKLFPDSNTELVIKKALMRLTNKLKLFKYSYLKSRSLAYDQSLSNGSLGIALLFLHASELFKDEKYKNIAQNILFGHPKRPISSHYGIDEGLSGAGIVYLEAFRICNVLEWKYRAEWIYQVITKTSIRLDHNKITWNSTGLRECDESLVSGNEGILLFLMEFYKMRNKSSYE